MSAVRHLAVEDEGLLYAHLVRQFGACRSRALEGLLASHCYWGLSVGNRVAASFRLMPLAAI